MQFRRISLSLVSMVGRIQENTSTLGRRPDLASKNKKQKTTQYNFWEAGISDPHLGKSLNQPLCKAGIPGRAGGTIHALLSPQISFHEETHRSVMQTVTNTALKFSLKPVATWSTLDTSMMILYRFSALSCELS